MQFAGTDSVGTVRRHEDTMGVIRALEGELSDGGMGHGGELRIYLVVGQRYRIIARLGRLVLMGELRTVGEPVADRCPVQTSSDRKELKVLHGMAADTAEMCHSEAVDFRAGILVPRAGGHIFFFVERIVRTDGNHPERSLCPRITVPLISCSDKRIDGIIGRYRLGCTGQREDRHQDRKDDIESGS